MLAQRDQNFAYEYRRIDVVETPAMKCLSQALPPDREFRPIRLSLQSDGIDHASASKLFPSATKRPHILKPHEQVTIKSAKQSFNTAHMSHQLSKQYSLNTPNQTLDLIKPTSPIARKLKRM